MPQSVSPNFHTWQPAPPYGIAPWPGCTEGSTIDRFFGPIPIEPAHKSTTNETFQLWAAKSIIIIVHQYQTKSKKHGQFVFCELSVVR
jgi:hypothetical protein